MPGLRRRSARSIPAGSSCGKAARQLASARCPRALFGKILRSNSGWRNQHMYWRAKRELCHPAEYPFHLNFRSEPDNGESHG